MSTILIVDDSEVHLVKLQSLLRERCLEVILAPVYYTHPPSPRD